MLHRNKRESSFQLFTYLKIFPIQHHVYKVLRLFYTRSGNTGTTDLAYITRGSEQRIFRLPKVNKSLFRQSLQYIGPKYFNQLPQDIKASHSKTAFSKKLKAWLSSKEDISFLNHVLS